MINRYEEASEAARQLLCDFDAIDIAEGAAAANAALDAAYRERAHLVAHLASLYPSHIGHTDPNAPEWAVVIVETPAGQMSWHIAERDLPLFAQVRPTDRLCRGWDGHTTDEKYERLEALIRGEGVTLTRTERAEAAIARVRAIHTPVTHNGDVICTDCSSYFDGSCEDWPYPYPCWTITNLDGPPPPPNDDEPEETPS